MRRKEVTLMPDGDDDQRQLNNQSDDDTSLDDSSQPQDDTDDDTTSQDTSTDVDDSDDADDSSSTPQLSAAQIAELQSENQRMRRTLAEQAKKEKRRKADAQKAEEQRQKEEGEWQKLAEQAQKERDEALEREQAGERARRIARVANRLKFFDPDDAALHLQEADIDLDDEQDVERALNGLAERKPYLLDTRDQQRKKQGAVNNNGPPASKHKWTRKELEQLTPEKQAEMQESGELQEALAQLEQ